MEERIERDSMGEMKVPEAAYYGAQTARARDNFPISGLRLPRELILALGAIKESAARVNSELGLLEASLTQAIVQAAGEVAEGKFDSEFVIDIFQTGSGTSSNMNTNEVVASRANEILTGQKGGKSPVHPNDHVNLGQSSNDTFPSAIQVAAALSCHQNLLPALERLANELEQKAGDWDDVVKIGRTHLMDATPVRLGQEASGWARQAALAAERIGSALARVYALPQGGTAVGTGINTHPEFGRRVAEQLAQRFGIPFRETENHFEAQHSRDCLAELAGVLAAVASGIFKIANDIRWLSSGPRCGLGEIVLPAVQPGSSIMPGKVNPVMCEALMMVSVQVMGNSQTVLIANTHGNLELNVMMPVMAKNLLESILWLANAINVFVEKALLGAEANRGRAGSFVEQSLAMVTALVPVIGYDRAAAISKEAMHENKTVRQLLIEQKILPEAEINRILDPTSMTEPGLGAGGE